MLSPGLNPVQLLAETPIERRRRAASRPRSRSAPTSTTPTRPTTRARARAPSSQPRPLKILFVPVAADDELRARLPRRARRRRGHRGVPQRRLAGRPAHFDVVDRLLDDARAPAGPHRGRPDGPSGMLMPRLDRLKWSAAAIDKVVGVVPRGWFSRQQIDGFAKAVGISPLGGTLDAAIVERQNTGGWVVAHELAHQLGWTEDAGAHGNHLDDEPAPGYWVDERRDIPDDDARLHAVQHRGRRRAQPDRALDVQEDVGLPHDQALAGAGATARACAAASRARCRSPARCQGRRRRDRRRRGELRASPTPARAGPADVRAARRRRRRPADARVRRGNKLGPIGGDDRHGRRARRHRRRGLLAARPGPGRRALAAHPPRRRTCCSARALGRRAGGRRRPRRPPAPRSLGADLKVNWNGDRRRRRRADAHRRDLARRRRDVALARRRETGTSLTVKASSSSAARTCACASRRPTAGTRRPPTPARSAIGGKLSDGRSSSTTGLRRRLDRGHRRQRREEDRHRGRHPRWSPDGTKLAWDDTDLFTAKPDGSDVQQGHDRQALHGAAVGRRRHDARQARERRPEGNQLVETADRRRDGLRVTSARSSASCATSHRRREVLGRAGLYEDSWTISARRRQGRRAARGEVLRLALARRPLRASARGTAATPTRASTSIVCDLQTSRSAT